MRKLWITDDPYPASPETIAAADQAGATEIVHGDTFVGYVEEPDPEVVTPPPTAEERLQTLLAALTDAQSLEEIRDAAAAAGGTP
jgi:hypothetical protein